MEFKFYLGVDVSKDDFHYCLLDAQQVIHKKGKWENTEQGVLEFSQELLGDMEEEIGSIILVMEHTGIYVNHLVRGWSIQGGCLSLVPGIKIGISMEGPQGVLEKTDELDARRIATYGLKFTEKLHIYQVSDEKLDLLQSLQRQRDRMIEVLNILKVPLEESKHFDTAWIYEKLSGLQQQSEERLEEDLKAIENEMKKLIEEDAELSQLFKWIISVEGVGPVATRELLIATQGFKRFRPNQAKAFAKFIGVVPTKKWESGKKKKRARTSKRMQHKRLKSILTLGASSLIRTNNELGHYYRRKLEEGKPPLSIINAMRNKIILRVFAVVRNQVMYKKNLNLCLD